MKRIGIICKTGRPEPAEILKGLLPWLGERGVEVFIDNETALSLHMKGYALAEIPELAEAVVVF